jgi:predicted PurR-regulated permease PerM
VADAPEGWLTRERLLVLVLLAVTVLAIVLCYLLALPFVPALTWAVALALVARPLHDALSRKISNPNLAAGATVFVVALMLVVPGIWVASQLVSEVAANADWVQEQMKGDEWRERLNQIPFLARTVGWLEQNVDLKAEARKMVEALTSDLMPLIKGSLWAAMQLLVMFLVLFYCLRDRGRGMRTVKSLLPLSERETDHVTARVTDTIHATIYGSVAVAIIQGFLGGLVFWWLGLPAPVFWGVVMAVLGVIPMLGTFMVWLPAAAMLFLQGRWQAGAFLTVWGLLVIGLIDNFLYPLFVGGRLRLHTLPTFIAIVGGMSVFGASGLILGPVTLALTLALIDVWKHRTAGGRPAEEGVDGLVEAPPQDPALPSSKVTVGAAE